MASGVAITQECQGCGQSFSLSPSRVGRIKRCPRCVKERVGYRAARQEAGRKGATTARERYGEDFHARRGLQAIEGARAKGKFPERLEKTCFCGQTFSVPPSRARFKRCPDCVAAGRQVCANPNCGTIITGAGDNAARLLCDGCRRDGKHGSPSGERVARTALKCQGMDVFLSETHSKACRRTYTYKTSRLSHPTHPLKGYNPSTGAFTSGPCLVWQNLIHYQVKQMRRAGMVERIESVTAYRRALTEYLVDTEDPDHEGRRRAPFGQSAQAVAFRSQMSNPAALIAARRERKGGESRGEAHSRAVIVGRWRKGVKFEFGICRWCGLLLIAKICRTLGRTSFHSECWHAVTRSEEGSQWLKNRTALRRSGLSEREIDKKIGAEIALPASKAQKGRAPNPAVLNEHFAWAIRHLVGGESLGDIAKAEGFSRSAVQSGVEWICRKLPAPGMAGSRLDRYVTLLHQASNSGGNARALGAGVMSGSVSRPGSGENVERPPS